MSPIGAVTHVFFQDLRAGSRDEWERVLWAESGVEALLRDLKSFKDLPAALPEVMLRVCRMHALQRELDALARRFSIQRLVSGNILALSLSVSLALSLSHAVSLALHATTGVRRPASANSCGRVFFCLSFFLCCYTYICIYSGDRPVVVRATDSSHFFIFFHHADIYIFRRRTSGSSCDSDKCSAQRDAGR